MAQAMEVHVEGLKELVRKLEPDLIGKPLGIFFQRATETIRNEAKREAPVDTGRLRSSLVGEVDTAQVPLFGKVGTPVHYAPYMEYGTGAMGDSDMPHQASHWPPGHALGVWASRHGFASGFQVARIIGKRGGLRPRRFLRGAVEQTQSSVQGFLRRLEQDVKDRWEAR